MCYRYLFSYYGQKWKTKYFFYKKKIFKFFHQYLIYYNFIEIKENYNNDDSAKLFSQQNKSNFAATLLTDKYINKIEDNTKNLSITIQ